MGGDGGQTRAILAQTVVGNTVTVSGGFGDSLPPMNSASRALVRMRSEVLREIDRIVQAGDGALSTQPLDAD